jgi:hypothetical protein
MANIAQNPKTKKKHTQKDQEKNKKNQTKKKKKIKKMKRCTRLAYALSHTYRRFPAVRTAIPDSLITNKFPSIFPVQFYSTSTSPFRIIPGDWGKARPG